MLVIFQGGGGGGEGRGGGQEGISGVNILPVVNFMKIHSQKLVWPGLVFTTQAAFNLGFSVQKIGLFLVYYGLS